MPGPAQDGGPPRYNPMQAVQRGGTRQPFLQRSGAGDEGLAELDALTSAVYGDLQRPGGAAHRARVAPPQAHGEPSAQDTGELLTVMCQRLKSLEATAAQLRQELLQKDKELLGLRRELGSAREARAEDSEVLKAQNTRLALQIVEMTQFLREHGLEWVGSGRASPLCGRRDPARGSGPRSAPASPAGEVPQPSAGRRSGRRSESSHAHSTPAASPKAQQQQPQQPRAAGGLALAGLGGDCWDAAAAAAPPPGAAEPTRAPWASGAGPYFSLDALKQRVAELNLLVGERRIVAEGNRLKDGAVVHQFAEPETVPIVVYRDGIVVNNGPFRPYGWPLCHAFIDDILEGYFPYEYKERFPDGMLMTVTDRSGEMHLQQPGEAGPRTVHDTEGYRVLSKADFLRRIPKQMVTPSGQIVDVRGEVADFMGGPAAPDAAAGGPGAPTEAPAVLPAGLRTVQVGDREQDGDDRPRVLVQVRIVGGGKLVARLLPTATVGELRGLVAQQLPPERRGCIFELLTAFPRRTYSDDGQTLEDAGLAPNAALLMRILGE